MPARRFAAAALLSGAAALLCAFWYSPLPVAPTLSTGDFQFRSWGTTGSYDGGFLSVWEDHRNGREQSKVWGARIDTAGNVLDPQGLAISGLPYIEWDPAVGCS